MKYGAASTSTDAVVGLSPGHTADFRAGQSQRTRDRRRRRLGGVGERFAEPSRSSTPSRSREKFYRTHPDNYDQLVLWTDTAV